MKKQVGDIVIVGAIIVVVAVLLFLKRDMIMEMLHIQPVSTEAEQTEDEAEAVEEENGDKAQHSDGDEVEVVKKDDASGNEAEAKDEKTSEEASEEAETAATEEKKSRITDPLLVADSITPNNDPVNVPTVGTVGNNVIGMSWTDLKNDYSYSDFEADPDDLAQLRFVDSDTVKFYQSPGSGEIFGVEDDKVVAYLKRWEGVPINEAITISQLFDVAPYIYQATDHLNFYEWQIENCYVGMLVEDTGSEMKDTAPLYAETYVERKAINSFYK